MKALPHPDAPPGWLAVDEDDPFEATNGPLFVSGEHCASAEEPVRLGWRVAPHNANMMGSAHGGVIAAFMDLVLGRAAWASAGRPSPTVSMTVDFVRAAHVGEWLEGRVRVTRKARRLVFADATILGDGGRTIARGSGLFAVPDA